MHIKQTHLARSKEGLELGIDQEVNIKNKITVHIFPAPAEGRFRHLSLCFVFLYLSDLKSVPYHQDDLTIGNLN